MQPKFQGPSSSLSDDGDNEDPGPIILLVSGLREEEREGKEEQKKGKRRTSRRGRGGGGREGEGEEGCSCSGSERARRGSV